jgi:peptidoglycan/LPS O-acetylase OafA/YrhL
MKRFDALDGLRGIAALSVVWLHSGRYADGWVSPIANLSVDLFFVLSGFVLAFAYEQAFRDGLSPWKFMVQRLIRLYPLYILGITMGMAVAVLNIHVGGGGFTVWTWDRFFHALPWAILMLPAPDDVDGTMFPFNFAMWSIFFELIANVLWAWRATASTRTLITTVAVAGLALIACGLYFDTLSIGRWWNTSIGGLARVMYAFPLGVLLYRAHKRVTLPELPTVPVLLGMLLLLLLPEVIAIELALSLFALPGLVFLASYAKPHGVLASACAFVGATSYAVYAMHLSLYALSAGVLTLVLGIDVEKFAPWGVLGFLAMVLVCAAIAQRWYDVPVRRWLTGKLVKRRTQPYGVTTSATPPA